MRRRTLDRLISLPHQDVLVGVTLLIFCAVAFWLTTTFRQVPTTLSQNVPPTFLPRLVLGAIVVLSIFLILKNIRRSRQTREKVKLRVLTTAAVITLSVVLIGPLGMLVALLWILVVLPLSWGERRWGRILVMAFAVPVAVYLIFTVLLGLRFPGGLLLLFISSF